MIIMYRYRVVPTYDIYFARNTFEYTGTVNCSAARFPTQKYTFYQ